MRTWRLAHQSSRGDSVTTGFGKSGYRIVGSPVAWLVRSSSGTSTPAITLTCGAVLRVTDTRYGLEGFRVLDGEVRTAPAARPWWMPSPGPG